MRHREILTSNRHVKNALSTHECFNFCSAQFLFYETIVKKLSIVFPLHPFFRISFHFRYYTRYDIEMYILVKPVDLNVKNNFQTLHLILLQQC